jgi:N-acetylneuraminic acid mutarotase
VADGAARIEGLDIIIRSKTKREETTMRRQHTKFLQLALVGAALGAFTSGACAQDKGSWAMKAPVPAALNEVAAAFVDGKLHVFGGSVLGFTGPFHVVYDPTTDKWDARTPAPFPNRLDHVGAAVLNGKIYSAGGFVGGGVHKDGQDAAYEYDPASNTWRILATMKLGRGSPAVVALDGKIHAIGGRGADGKTVGTHEIYDPATNKWTDAAPVKRTRDHAAAGVIDGKIYYAGGRTGASTDSTNFLDIYDPKTNTWTEGPPMPTKRSGLAGVTYKGMLLVFGGEVPRENRTNSENEAFDPKANAWRTLAPMPAGRHATNAATDGNHVYLAGGSLGPGGSGVTDQLIVFTMP